MCAARPDHSGPTDSVSPVVLVNGAVPPRSYPPGWRPVAPPAGEPGGLFAQAQITGVVDHDFFDWVVEVAGGRQWVKTLARRLARFAWGQVEHDVMKILYESVSPRPPPAGPRSYCSRACQARAYRAGA